MVCVIVCVSYWSGKGGIGVMIFGVRLLLVIIRLVDEEGGCCYRRCGCTSQEMRGVVCGYGCHCIIGVRLVLLLIWLVDEEGKGGEVTVDMVVLVTR